MKGRTIALLGAVLLLACRAAATQAPAAPGAARPVLLTGEVEALDSQTLFVPPSNSSPLILRTFLPEGTQVKKGDVVLRTEAGGATNVDQLRADLERARARADSEVATLEVAAVEADLRDPFAPVPTLSPALALVCSKLKRFAPSSTELFLLGETGVGKEVFAHAIHARSGRTGPLLAINCAALPRELVESELFGYEKGAHSAARERRTGLIAAADKGTLFLDELGEMPMESQSKLLRFLQDRQYFPIGSSRAHTADVRIIAASSRAALVGSTPAIQEALLGRLGAQPIVLPPLRRRVEDLGRLIAHFMGNDLKPFEPEAYHALFLHQWPHNVRELQKVIAEAQLLAQDRPAIGLEHLPEAVVATLQTGLVLKDDTNTNTGSGPVSIDSESDNGGGEVETATSATGSGKTRIRRPPPSAEELTALLQQYKGNVSHVAKHLDRQWAVIWRVLQRYGINPDDFRE